MASLGLSAFELERLKRIRRNREVRSPAPSQLHLVEASSMFTSVARAVFRR